VRMAGAEVRVRYAEGSRIENNVWTYDGANARRIKPKWAYRRSRVCNTVRDVEIEESEDTGVVFVERDLEKKRRDVSSIG